MPAERRDWEGGIFSSFILFAGSPVFSAATAAVAAAAAVLHIAHCVLRRRMQ